MTDDPLNKLYPSSANVRKTGAKDGIEGLAQSIHNHGLLNNLVVQPGGEKETFSVLAGGRLLAALNHLAKAKLIPADWGVPCNEIEIEIEGRHSERGDQPCWKRNARGHASRR
jgi:ParB family transcriptional regulator, chromosome partitioning protein